MNFDEAYAKLNDEQKKAVDNIDGPCMVLAGPGTGKTQIIALRIARILQKTQLSPHNILCLTFTESGVTAMRKRLTQIIGPTAYYVRIHTFHSFCNEIILDNPEKFFFTRDMAPLTDVERVQIMRGVLDNLPVGTALKPFSDSYLYQKDIENAVSNLKREDITEEVLEQVLNKLENLLKEKEPELTAFVGIHGNSLKEDDVLSIQKTLAGTFFEGLFVDVDISDKKERTALKNQIKSEYEDAVKDLPKQKELLNFYREYQKTLKERGRYDFEDMILFVLNLLKNNDLLLARLQEQFQYILVDEYQDTNGAQNEVIQLIGEFFENPNIFVVGDDKQSIYRFQGASLENILYFYNLYKNNVNIIALKNNYRSGQTILDGARSLIKNNEQGIHTLLPNFDEELIAKSGNLPQKIGIAELSTEGAETYFLAKSVQGLLEAGTDPKEIAIIYHNNREAEPIKDLFLRLKIPFRLLSGTNILDDKSLNNLIGLMRFLGDQNDNKNLFFVLNYDFLNFDPVAVIKLTHRAYETKKTLYETAIEEEPFKTFLEKCATWNKESVNKTLAEFFEILINESGYLKHLLNKPNKVEHLNRLNTFFDQIKSLNKANTLLTLQDFIVHIDLLKENKIEMVANEFLVQKDAVTLMTAHKSKGLEFEHVFISGCRDKHWGNQRAQNRLRLPHGLLKTERLSHKEKNEDERRLFYVALTRAKKTATLSYSAVSESGREEVPSLFIQELDPNTCEKIDVTKIENSMEDQLELSFTPIVKNAVAEEEAFVKELLENYIMSVTHLNNYLQCPRLFYFNNLLQVPRAKTKSASFGTAVHEALKDLINGYKIGELPGKSYFLSQFEKHLKHEILTQEDFKNSLEYGTKTLSEYYDNYKDQFPKNALLEYSFGSHGVRFENIPITGKLDKIEFLAKDGKDVHVVDYKTGNPDSKSHEFGADGKYKRQIAFYKLLCDLSPKFAYKMVSGEINFVEKSAKEKTFIRRNVEITPADMERLKEEIKTSYDEIMNLKFLHPDEWKVCGECEYCKEFNAK
ncbi:MAG: ATP-dependent DNA helicase [Candidatus Gracilibacteria bacterium]